MSEDKWTALHFAVAKNHDKAAALLLSKGLDVNAKTNRLYTALHIAAEGERIACIPILLQRGANLDELDDQGRTPLMLAKHAGKQRAAELLPR